MVQSVKEVKGSIKEDKEKIRREKIRQGNKMTSRKERVKNTLFALCVFGRLLPEIIWDKVTGANNKFRAWSEKSDRSK